MARWFRIDDALLDDPTVQRLTPAKFRRAFIAALAGEANDFSQFVRPDSGRLPALEWAALRAQVFERDNYTCVYCGEHGTRLECDHVEPVSRGGTNGIENLATACLRCNRAKRAKTLKEWLS